MPMMSQNKGNRLWQTKEASFHSERSIILFDAHIFNIALFINGKERRCMQLTKDGSLENFNIYFINTSWFWWLDVLNAIGRHVVDSPGLGLLDLVLVELHRLPRTWRRRPLRWRLQNRFGDGEFRRRRRRWRRLFCPEELVHETCFAIFDDALLWWHRGCWRSKGGTEKQKNQIFNVKL